MINATFFSCVGEANCFSKVMYTIIVLDLTRYGGKLFTIIAPMWTELMSLVIVILY